MKFLLGAKMYLYMKNDKTQICIINTSEDFCTGY